jgi:hypothetical protein
MAFFFQELLFFAKSPLGRFVCRWAVCGALASLCVVQKARAAAQDTSLNAPDQAHNLTSGAVEEEVKVGPLGESSRGPFNDPSNDPSFGDYRLRGADLQKVMSEVKRRFDRHIH